MLNLPPLVCDPLAANDNGTSTVLRHHVVTSVLVHVPPRDHGTLQWNISFGKMKIIVWTNLLPFAIVI